MIRIIIVLFALVTVGGCQQRMGTGAGRPATDPVALARQEDSNRKYFVDSFAYVYGNGFNKDSLHNFRHFFKTRYPEVNTPYAGDPLPYAFEEAYLDTTKIDTGKRWFRIIVDPCFGIPYCIIIARSAGRTWLTLKLTSGRGCLTLGQLYITKTMVVEDSLQDKLFQKLDSIRFWGIGIQPDCGGTDGATWTFEALDRGRYKRVVRWSPGYCGEPAAIALSVIGGELGKLANLEDYRDLVLKEVHQIYRDKRSGH